MNPDLVELIIGISFAGFIGLMIAGLIKTVKRRRSLPLWPVATCLMMGGTIALAGV